MKKFKFSLEKVLSLREFEENQAQIELAKAISVVTELNNKLKIIANERVKNNDARSNSTDLSYLMSIEKYIEGLDYQKEILKIYVNLFYCYLSCLCNFRILFYKVNSKI